MGSQCSTGTEFQLGGKEIPGDGWWRWLSKTVNALNATLTMVKMADFMFSIFCHNKPLKMKGEVRITAGTDGSRPASGRAQGSTDEAPMLGREGAQLALCV